MRRCLVVSDCKGALELMEWAWRGGQVGALRRSKRGGILEAICRMRAQLGLVVTMYAPAHRGGSMSAYADAEAKTNLEDGMDEGKAEWMRERLIRDREGRQFGYELVGPDGISAPWNDAVFDMAREATGAWVRAQEVATVRTGAADCGTVLVDRARLGVVEVEGEAEWWGAVLRGTGVEREVERGQERSPAAAAAEAAQVRRENERCGLAAAMRNGLVLTPLCAAVYSAESASL